MLGQHERELAEVRRGRAVYRDILWTHAWEAGALAALGRLDEVAQVIEESTKIASRSGTAGDVMGWSAEELRAHGHREASLKIALRAVEWYRTRPTEEATKEGTRSGLGRALFLAERWEEARAVYEELAAQHPDDVGYLGGLGVLAARRGDRTEAERITEELRKIERPYLNGRHTYQRACIAAQLGEKDKAVELLRESFAQGVRHSVRLHSDIDLEPLHGYPPFEELLKPKGRRVMIGQTISH